MDLLNNHQMKRRYTESTPRMQFKNTAFSGPQPTTPHNNKGKVKIQQYAYDEEHKLGEGFTSKVYLGWKNDDPKDQFAIKVIDKRKLSHCEQNLELLKQEIHIHKQLDHPNIVKCHEIIEKTNFYYFVLEYCPHGTLDSFIKKHEKLTESTTICIMEQIVAGYKYLMRQKVIHRDLKPPNILKSGPNWKICDFGFSVIGKKNLVGYINVGTPAYMAPQALQRTYYSPKTDFFSLGVLCYEMLFGATPWEHKNEQILLQLIKQSKIKQQVLKSLNNENLVVFIRKCCQSNQRRRMNQQQFQNFSFWKDFKKEQLEVLQNPNIRKNSLQTSSLNNHKLNIKDDPSTCHSKSQTSNNTSVIGPSTKIQKQISMYQPFSANTAIIQRQMHYATQSFSANTAMIQRQLYSATVIYILLKNHSYLLFEQAEQKELFMCLLNKHASHIFRRIKHTKVNYLGLNKWQEYCLSQAYLKLSNQAAELQAKIQEMVSKQIKRRSIIIIRQINSKFDDLAYDKNPSLATINNLKNYLIQLMNRLVAKYQLINEQHVKQNISTRKVLEYLIKYYNYLAQITFNLEESRSIAIDIKKQLKNQNQLQYDFGEPKLCFQQFQCLKLQINTLCI